MPPELELRLERLLGRRSSSAEVEERALALALGALPRPHRSRRLPALVLAAAAALAVLGVAAGALAAAGALHVSLGSHRPPARPVTVPELRVPAGAAAVAAVVDGRLWLTATNGLRIQGLPVDSATLSPHALYVAAGVGDSLVAMAPDGTRAWSQPTRGPVVAIAWAPDALRIAYVVRANHGFELRTIEGNGLRDRLLDAHVRPVAPSWRSDSLAVAYAGAGGRPVVFDFGHDSHSVVLGRKVGAVTGVAFAPSGTALAVISTSRLFLVTPMGVHAHALSGRPAGVAWLGDSLAVGIAPAGTRTGAVELFATGRQLFVLKRRALPGRVSALASTGQRLVIAVRAAGSATRVLLSRDGTSPDVLLALPAAATVDALAVR